MTEQELVKVRDLVEDLEKCASTGAYFEISCECSDLLARYIRELEQRVVRLK